LPLYYPRPVPCSRIVMSALGFHVSSRIMTLDSAGYSYLSLVSQHTLPTQAYAADAVAAEKANITVAVTAAKTYFIFTPLIAPRLSATGVTHLSSLYGRELGEPQITIADRAPYPIRGASAARLRGRGRGAIPGPGISPQ